MTIRDLCIRAGCLGVSLCVRSDGYRSSDAQRVDHFHDSTGDEACHS